MFNRLTRNIEFDNNSFKSYTSKYDNPRYQLAIKTRKIENARKSKEKRFLAEEINKKAIQIITLLIFEYRKENKSEELKSKIFINQFYYNCAFDLDGNFSKYGQLSEKQVNFILTFEEKMKANMIKHKEKIADKMNSSFIGTVGTRQDFNLTILNVKEKELQVSYSNYVTSFKHDLIDKDKNLYTMYSSKNYREENNNNNEINISAIVKAHKTFNHVNYTHIKCPKIIK